MANAETAAAQPPAMPSNPEVEPFPKFSILMPGAGQGTGWELARVLAREGYPVIAGSREMDKFNTLAAAIKQDGGVAPTPFIADLTHPDEVQAAYEALELPEGTPVHYFPIAAGGLASVNEVLKPIFFEVMRAGIRGTLTEALLAEYTEQIRAITTSDEAMRAAREINVEAPLRLFHLLKERGHITSESQAATLSSTGSHNADPDHPDIFTGPFLYYGVAHSKEEGVRRLRREVVEAGAQFTDFVAPEISDTGVGGLLKKLTKAIDKVPQVVLSPTPSVTRDQVVRGMHAELAHPSGPDANASSRTVYLTEMGAVHTQPQGWDAQLIPYL